MLTLQYQKKKKKIHELPFFVLLHLKLRYFSVLHQIAGLLLIQDFKFLVPLSISSLLKVMDHAKIVKMKFTELNLF